MGQCCPIQCTAPSNRKALSQQWVFEWISALATAVKLAFKRLCARDSVICRKGLCRLCIPVRGDADKSLAQPTS